MNIEELKKEQRNLSIMRKTLSNIVRDATPVTGNPHPLSNGTIEEIKYCFAIISGREKELADKLGFDQPKPHHTNDQQPNSNGVSFVKLSRIKV
jgi:hypothetical protein